MPDLRIVLIRDIRAASRCSACGADDSIEFHHIRPKRFALGERDVVRRVPLHVVINEIERCIPLCHSCHTQLHQTELCVNIEQSSRTHLAVVHAVRVMLGAKPPRTSRNVGRKRRRRKKPTRPV